MVLGHMPIYDISYGKLLMFFLWSLPFMSSFDLTLSSLGVRTPGIKYTGHQEEHLIQDKQGRIQDFGKGGGGGPGNC